MSLVTNQGSATFIDVIGSAVDITNNGAIIVDGSSHVNMKLTSCGSSSSVVYKAGTQGGISAPYGCSVTINPGSSATVTYQEAAAPTTTPAPSILLKADPDTPHFTTSIEEQILRVMVRPVPRQSCSGKRADLSTKCGGRKTSPLPGRGSLHRSAAPWHTGGTKFSRRPTSEIPRCLLVGSGVSPFPASTKPGCAAWKTSAPRQTT